MTSQRRQCHALTLLIAILASSVRPSYPRPFHRSTAHIDGKGTSIIILAGQSNMSGRGGVVNNTWDHRVPPGCEPSPSILRLSAADRWEVARDPLHWDIDTYAVCGVGPGMPFAGEVVRRRPWVKLGLVPCAVGATKIDQWSKGTELYEKMVTRTKVALGSSPDGSFVGALLWYQGESDTIDINDARSYAVKMERFVADVRADLQLPDLVVIQVALATGMGPHLNEVREQQMSVQLPNLYTVDAKGSHVSSDYVHLTTAGEVRVGTLLANSYILATHH